MADWETIPDSEAVNVERLREGDARLTMMPDTSLPQTERPLQVEHNRKLMDKISQRFGRIGQMTPTGFDMFRRSLAKHRGLSSSMRGLLSQYARDVRSGKLPPEDAIQKIKDAEENRLGLHRIGLEGTLSSIGGPMGKAGAMALGAAGKMLPGVGRVLGGATGAGMGSLAAETFDPTENPALTAALAAGASPVGDVLGAGLNRLATGGFLRKQLKPGAEAMLERLPAKETLTLGQATDNALVDTAENIAENSFGGARRVLMRKEATHEWAESNLRAHINALMSGTKEELGEILQRAIAASFENFKHTSRGFYKAVDKFAPTTKVPVYRIKQTAQKLLNQVDQGVIPPGQAREVLEEIVALPDMITFERASIIRSQLLQVGRSGTDLIGNQAQAFAKTLTPSMTAAMTKAAKGVGPEALAAWKIAGKHWKGGVKQYNSQLIKSIAAREPEVVFQIAVKNGRPGTIRRVRTIVNDEKIWRQVQGQYLDDIFNASATGKEFKVSAIGLQRRLNRMGDDALKELFPGDGAETFKRAVQELALAQGGTTVNIGRMWIQMGQAGALGRMLFWELDAASSAILVAPPTLAYLFTRPGFVKWMTIARKAKPGSKELLNAIAKMKAMALKQGAVETVDPGFYAGP